MDKENKFNAERTRTMLLCAIAGFLGAHEFYQKKYLKGALFIFFGTLGLFGASMHQLSFLIFCLPIVFIASFISQIRLIINKKNTDIEFCLGIFFLLLQFGSFSFSPVAYDSTKTEITKNVNGESKEKVSIKF